MADETTPATTPPTSVQSTPPTAPSSSPATTEAAPPEAPKTLLNEGTEPPKAEEPKGAPEAYETFKVPDGFELDPVVAKDFSDLAKTMNLPQAQAQELVDFYVAKTQEAFTAPFKAYKDMQEGWVNEAKDHPELRGKLDQVKNTVAAAIDGLGDAKLASDFRAAMDLTGAGNHPAFIRVFYKLAQAVTEGTHVRGAGPSPHGQTEGGTATRPSAARSLYPNLP